jgi:hypothetical protein
MTLVLRTATVPSTLLTIAKIIALLVGLPIAGLVVLALWSRRGERRADATGVRTLATFGGGARYVLATERQAQRQSGEPVGEALLQAVAGELRQLGLSVTEVDQHESFGWAAHIERGGAKAYLLLGERPDGEHKWVLSVQDPSSGGPGPRSLLGAIDAALKRLAELRDITWHSRQCFDRGDEVSTAASSPIDE